MKIRDCDYQDSVFSDLVDDPVGETSNLTPSGSFRGRLPCFRILANSIKGIQNFGKEGITEPRDFIVVILDGIIKLSPCDV